MKNVKMIASLVALLVAGTAYAQEKKPAAPAAPPAKAAPAEPAKAEPAKPAAPDMAAMMKPAPELEQYKGMIGTWKCEGKGTGGGMDMAMKGTYTAAWDLDNHVVVAKFNSPKSKEMPNGMKGMDIYTYDSVSKQFVTVGMDSMGAMSTMTSKGWEGDKQEWVGKAKMMGMEMDSKMTVTRNPNGKEVHLSGSQGSGPQAMSFEMNCKK